MTIRLIDLPHDYEHPAKSAKRWVVKVGSSLLTQNGQGLDAQFIQDLVAQIIQLRQRGIEVALVTSGAIAQGMKELGWTTRPKHTAELQAAAAVGQMGLVQFYQAQFSSHDVLSAQILLTHDDLSNRERYLNARATLQHLLQLNVIPIINENDTVITSEIKFGDNDTLAALVANLVDADVLILLTDQSGIYTENPTKNPYATLIEAADAFHPRLLEVAGNSGSHVGTGGMASKVFAAKRAAKSGIHTIIAGGKILNVLPQLADGAFVGTLLLGMHHKISARKQWILDHLQVGGMVHLDNGAYHALKQGRSLLPIGLDGVSGQFQRGDVITCMHQGCEIARGITQYDSTQARMIMKKNSDEIIAILGYAYAEELIHRNDLVMLDVHIHGKH